MKAKISKGPIDASVSVELFPYEDGSGYRVKLEWDPSHDHDAIAFRRGNNDIVLVPIDGLGDLTHWLAKIVDFRDAVISRKGER